MTPDLEQINGEHQLAWELAWQARDDNGAAGWPDGIAHLASQVAGDDYAKALQVLATYAWHLRVLAADSAQMDVQWANQRVCEQAAHSHLSRDGGGGS